MADSDSGAAGESPALFNPETMSGISPGRRTQAFQRFRVCATGAKVASGWRRLLWKEPEQRGDLIQADLEQFEAGLRQWERCDLAPLLAPNARALADLMVQKLAESGQEALLCGTCAHWQQESTAAADAAMTGRCTLQPGAPSPVHTAMARHSFFALDCPHWEGGRRDAPAHIDEPESADPSSDAGQKQAAPPSRLRRWFTRLTRQRAEEVTPRSGEELLVEQSGVGAGTEPCPACSGRIANLASAAWRDPEGDTVVVSLWRCRLCFTLYANQWIDRWERLDTLETEETYYRIAPRTATKLYERLQRAAGQAQSTAAQPPWGDQFLSDRPVLSRQVRQGR